MNRLIGTAALIAALCATGTSAVSAADIVRHPLPGGDKFPIASAVDVPAGYKLVFHSGITPAPADPKAENGTAAYWGDTKTQSMSALSRLQKSLQSMGLSCADVVKMTVFMVADPATGHMDFKGFMAAYSQFFGTREQPNLPARSAVQVAGLAAPGALVEIEVILATPATK